MSVRMCGGTTTDLALPLLGRIDITPLVAVGAWPMNNGTANLILMTSQFSPISLRRNSVTLGQFGIPLPGAVPVGASAVCADQRSGSIRGTACFRPAAARVAMVFTANAAVSWSVPTDTHPMSDDSAPASAPATPPAPQPPDLSRCRNQPPL